jgi:hypothetical protein
MSLWRGASPRIARMPARRSRRLLRGEIARLAGNTLSVLAAVALSSGCTSLSSFKEAHPIDRGAVRFDAALSGAGAAPVRGATAFLGGRRPSANDSSENAKSALQLQLQLRFGAFPGADVGLKTNLSSIELNSTIQLLRGASFELAFAPALQAGIGSNLDDEGWSINVIKLPILTGFRFGDGGRHELVLGPTVARMWGRGTAKNEPYGVSAWLAGGTVGISFESGFGRVMPEVAVFSTVGGSAVALTPDIVRVWPDVSAGSPILYQAGVAFAFGSGARSR